jgi:hypothetical protein
MVIKDQANVVNISIYCLGTKIGRRSDHGTLYLTLFLRYTNSMSETPPAEAADPLPPRDFLFRVTGTKGTFTLQLPPSTTFGELKAIINAQRPEVFPGEEVMTFAAIGKFRPDTEEISVVGEKVIVISNKKPNPVDPPPDPPPDPPHESAHPAAEPDPDRPSPDPSAQNPNPGSGPQSPDVAIQSSMISDRPPNEQQPLNPQTPPPLNPQTPPSLKPQPPPSLKPQTPPPLNPPPQEQLIAALDRANGDAQRAADLLFPEIVKQRSPSEPDHYPPLSRDEIRRIGDRLARSPALFDRVVTWMRESDLVAKADAISRNAPSIKNSFGVLA